MAKHSLSILEDSVINTQVFLLVLLCWKGFYEQMPNVCRHFMLSYKLPVGRAVAALSISRPQIRF